MSAIPQVTAQEAPQGYDTYTSGVAPSMPSCPALLAKSLEPMATRYVSDAQEVRIMQAGCRLPFPVVICPQLNRNCMCASREKHLQQIVMGCSDCT